MTIGQQYSTAIVKFPDDLSCTQAMLSFREFRASTETPRAHPESEWSKITEDLQ